MLTVVRGRYVISRDPRTDRLRALQDAAVAIADGMVQAVGPSDAILAAYRPDRVFGSQRHVVIPGLVNSHHHIGLTPFQLGATDLPMEVWNAERLGCRTVDPYLDTLYAAFQMVESGVTTVQHVQAQPSGPTERWAAVADDVVRAYKDAGMRVAYCISLRDRNRFVYGPDAEFTARLPPALASWLGTALAAQDVAVDEQLGVFKMLWERFGKNRSAQVRIQLAPAAVQWCSDRTFEDAQAAAASAQTRLHTNLLESRYQKEFARRAFGVSAVRHLHDLGYLGPQLTLAHAVWPTAEDVELLARGGVTVAHNASSNLRLRSGIAPVRAMIAAGIPVAVGVDEAGINDDHDMLQELRLVLAIHQPPDEAPALTAAAVLRMATGNGNVSTGFADAVGMLDVGKAADMTLIDWDAVADVYLDDRVPTIDAVVRRARASSVRSVFVDGEPILLDGRLTRVNKAEVLKELEDRLALPLTPAEIERAKVSKALQPFVREFYRGWLDAQEPSPFYPVNDST